MLQNLQSNTKSTIIKQKCIYCGKLAQARSSVNESDKLVITLECGHTLIEYLEKQDQSWTTKSLSGKEPFPFQYKTLEFTRESNFRTGIFHDMGVGKTICSLITVKKYPEKLLPMIVFCKRNLYTQWVHEIFDWLSLPAHCIENEHDQFFPELFKVWIVSIDLVRNKKVAEKISKLPLKLAIIDECQQIKNSQAKRTQSLRTVISGQVNGNNSAIPYVFGLSGTPIKNHAGEYFSILNILRPDIFPSQAQYERDYCDTYSNGWSYKIGGFSRYGADEFKEKTKNWIIRYEREEVLPDLPKIFRKNLFIELGEEVEKMYKAAYMEFRADYLSGGSGGSKFQEAGNTMARLSGLRHITGLAKIDPCTEFVREFLEDTDRKICLFVHHKDVGAAIFNRLNEVCNEMKILGPLQLTSLIGGTQQGQDIDQLWKSDPARRIMIASTLSAGEGKNWQMCQDAILVERQWNPANEEQAEGRFPRPGSIAESISVTYITALGTPDEYFGELVSKKREICKKTYGNEAISWDQDSLIKEMSELLIQKGGKKWGL